MTKLILTAALLSTSSFAAAQNAPAPAATPIKDPDKRVCRSEVPTGSIMAGKRVCHTRAEWAAIGRVNGDTVDHWRDNRRGGGVDSGGGFRPGS